MAQRHKALFASELAIVLAFQNGIFKHARGADKVHAVIAHVLKTRALLPLDHALCLP